VLTAAKLPRPPSVKNAATPTHPPRISCGTREQDILRVLQNLGDGRFNVHAYAREKKVSRSTVYKALSNLESKGLVSSEFIGGHHLTPKGFKWIQAQSTHRTVGRGAGGDSYVRDHKFTFEIPIRSYPDSWADATVGLINRQTIQSTLRNFSKNNPLLYAKFPDDVDVVITTTRAIIKPKNILANDHSEAALDAITKAHAVIDHLLTAGFGLLDKNGILPLIQKEGHYAEVNSLLSEFFERHAKGFHVLGRDGRARFWVDHSDGHREDETSDETSRMRLQRAMFDIMDNDLPKFSNMAEDLFSLKSITADLVKLQARQIAPIMPRDLDAHKIERIDYCG